MLRILSIGPARRRSGWSEIRLEDPDAPPPEGGERLDLPDREVSRLALEPGDPVDLRRLRALRAEALASEATHIALRYLSVRPRSRRELELRLLRKGVAAEFIDAALARCEELGHVDDRAFAAALARDRIRLRPCGVFRLRIELGRRGVSDADAESGIRQAFRDERVTEQELLERAAAGRVDRLRRLEPRVAKRRLFSFLRRRGFAPGDIRAWMAREERAVAEGDGGSDGKWSA